MTNWTEKDLDLFKSRRQRGTAPRPPADAEFRLHCALADVLRRWGAREWRWTHIPLGEYRTKATAVRLYRMGVTPGWPDFMFFHCHGEVCFLELKARGNKLTEAQEELKEFLWHAHAYLCTDNFDDALNFLREHRIVLAAISSHTSPRESPPCQPAAESPIEGS